MLNKIRSLKAKISTLQFITIGYFVTILIGALLLLLPFASKSGKSPNFIDSLFISASATCVTGLSVFDTFTQWTFFGQLVILILIQIGGLGFMTVITIIFLIFKKNIGLYERTILIQSAGTFSFSGIVSLIQRIVIGTFIVEATGAILLSIQFIQDFGWARGIWFGIFHSISAYCNAGFDLLGVINGNSSLGAYYNNPLVILTISALIIIGGLGFIVWSELIDNKFHVKELSLHGKMVLIFNAFFLIIGFCLFFIFEYNYTLKDLPFGEKILSAWFMSVTPRTAGFGIFSAYDYSQAGIITTIVLMFIGGNPGSTAGGVKTTTIIVVLANVLATAKQKDELTIFKKKINNKVVKQASALFIAYLIVSLISILIICAIEPNYSANEITYEVISGIATVGLSFGITSNLCWGSKIILILLMYAGRCGALTLFSAFVHKNSDRVLVKCAEGKILVG